MVMSATMAIRCVETLGLWNKLTSAMFCSVVAFFTTRKDVDVRGDTVYCEYYILYRKIGVS